MNQQGQPTKTTSNSMVKDRSWSTPQKVGFRFLFLYFSLLIPFQNTSFPFWDVLFKYPTIGVQQLIIWLGANVYGISKPISVQMTGSGDTTYHYLFILTAFLIAVMGTVLWSFLDRKRPHYKRLYYWLTVGVRYYIALMLVGYGLIKVIQLQFPSPNFFRLIEPYGESSPMGLAWTFLGFSKGYNIFMGVAELLAGLLLFRRTMVLGAIITLMTTMNVMAVNYFYDIPVKIVSTHLVLMTLFLLSNDAGRLTRFFFYNASTKLKRPQRPISNRALNIGIDAFKILLLGYVFIYGFVETLEAEKEYGAKAPKPELYGVYEIIDFTINGDTITNYKNERLWKTMAVYRDGFLLVRKFNADSNSYYKLEKDSLVERRLRLTNVRDKKESFDFNYIRIDSTGLDFNYVLEGDTIHGSTKRMTEKDFLLTNRGFHWISEYPFNR